MKFSPTRIEGAYLITPERHQDVRGTFTRVWCEQAFDAAGLVTRLAQCSLSSNHKRGTLRGMHWQAAPHEEVKIVRCVRGAIFDVIADVREGSTSFGQWAGFELDASAGLALYIPEGVAHGFQTLADDTDVFYQMSVPFHPESARTLAWNHPRFAIRWPVADKTLSPKDAAAGRVWEAQQSEPLRGKQIW